LAKTKKPRWNTSPVGWYVGSYVLRFIELAEKGNFDPERRFLAWENTVLVQASDLDDAYDKIAAIAQRSTEPYKVARKVSMFSGFSKVLPRFCRYRMK